MADNENPQVEPVEETPAGEASTSTRQFVMNLIPSLIVSLTVTLLALLAYQHWAPSSTPRIGMVDVAEVVKIKQLSISVRLVQPGVTDKERGEAWDQISAFTKSMEGALADIQKTCGCVLLVRPAVVGGAQDYTEVLKGRVGLAGLDVEKLSQQIVKATGTTGGVPPGK